MKTSKFANQINSDILETVQMAVVLEDEIFQVNSFNALAAPGTIEWE